MCLLTYYPQGADVDTDALNDGAVINQDGHGFAILSRGRIIIRKGMDASRMIDRRVAKRFERSVLGAMMSVIAFIIEWRVRTAIGSAGGEQLPRSRKGEFAQEGMARTGRPSDTFSPARSPNPAHGVVGHSAAKVQT